MNIQDFAQKYQVPVFTKDSKFPSYYATHVIDSEDVLGQEYLFSVKKLGKANFSTKIDEYLGATNFVFFGLGKGYLTRNKPSISLIYDPFELVKTPGANMVENDLLYVLENKKLLNEFLIKNWQNIEKILKNNIPENKTLKFKQYLIKNNPLLVIKLENVNQKNNAQIFDDLLGKLDPPLDKKLKELLDNEIVKKYTIEDNLETRIKDIYNDQSNLLNKFFDETSIEKMVEIRIPDKYPIKNGLISVYEN